MKRALGTIAGIVVAIIVFVAAYAAFRIFGDRSHPRAIVHVIVPRGATFHQIADELAGAGVISNALTFRIYGKMTGKDRLAHAGEFRFEPHQTQAQVLGDLQKGGTQIARWVTFPEGFTAKQIAQRLAQNDFGNWQNFYHSFMTDSLTIDGVRTKNMEGYLFPSTYLIPTDATPRVVEQIMTSQFQRELPRGAVSRARSLGLTIPQVVTLASLVQQEGKADDERPLIAGVIYNRLRDRMPLQIDASLEYAFAEHHTVITQSDLAIDSPYNTYRHMGLPPTPIANPGKPSLDAALAPQRSNYLYYVAKGDGHHAFAATLAEQLANERKYLK